MHGAFLGPAPDTAHLRRMLDARHARYREYANDEALCDAVAELIAREQVIGWFQGRMEFGPRALGARSIIGDPRSPSLQSTMNLKTKFRESFRPFAPVVLKERTADFFDMEAGTDSPYMLLVAPVREERRRAHNGATLPTGLDRVNMVRSDIPAVTHVDYSARVQTVDRARHGRFYTLLKAFERRTGCPVLINTSFNVRGEPIVCTPEQAYRCFMATNMDALVIERTVLLKSEQPASRDFDAAEYAAAFQAD
jgi:carbamoyltransferase